MSDFNLFLRLNIYLYVKTLYKAKKGGGVFGFIGSFIAIACALFVVFYLPYSEKEKQKVIHAIMPRKFIVH
jgi:hypothetical protein